MLTTVKGIYEDGIIKPLEKIRVKGKTEVIVIFLDTTREKKSVFLSAAGAWKDVDTEALKMRIYENRKISTRGDVNL
ncbi:MAG: antitoxin family protein [bacterium]